MSRFTPVTATSASIAPGASLIVNLAASGSVLNIGKIKVAPSAAGGTTTLGIYKRDTCLSGDLLFPVTTFTGTFIYPMGNVGGVSVELLEGFVCPYEDLDASSEIHLKITNNSDVAKTYAIEIKYDTYQLVTAGDPEEGLFIGDHAGENNTTAGGGFNGLYNTLIGHEAGKAGTTHAGITAVGTEALKSNTTGNYNTAIGWQALKAHVTGNYNVAVGIQTLLADTTGIQNTAVGIKALIQNTTGSNNTSIGAWSMNFNTTGISNVALGYFALYSNTDGDDNTAIGHNALYSNLVGDNNTAVGLSALYSSTAATGLNTGVGTNAGYAITTGWGNTFIGTNAGNAGQLVSAQRSTGIGYGAVTDKDDQVVLGDTSLAEVMTHGKIIKRNANGQETIVGNVTELVTMTSGEPHDHTTIQIPANSIVLAVEVRVTAVPATTADFTVTGTTTATVFQAGAHVDATLNNADPGMTNCPLLNINAQTITLTYNAAPTDSLGRVRVTIHYLQIGLAQS